jgi:quercetin dioxygenase-like cupin family protein
MMQEARTEYRNHVIWMRSYELKTGEWVPRAVVLFPPEEGAGEEELISPGESPMLSCEEADEHALLMSRKWVDQKLANSVASEHWQVPSLQASFERPFKPVALTAAMVKSFALDALAQQLMTEKAFTEHGRDGLTLVRGEGLTLVLTVVQEGKVCEKHTSIGPTSIIVLSGAIALVMEGMAEKIFLESGSVVAVANHMVHVIEAHADSTFLTIIGEQEMPS